MKLKKKKNTNKIIFPLRIKNTKTKNEIKITKTKLNEEVIKIKKNKITKTT